MNKHRTMLISDDLHPDSYINIEFSGGKDGDDGETGPKGDVGDDGYSPTIDLEEGADGTTIIITDKNGTKSTTIAGSTGVTKSEFNSTVNELQSEIDFNSNLISNVYTKSDTDVLLSSKQHILTQGYCIEISPDYTINFKNNAGYVTANTSDLNNYYTKEISYTKEEIDGQNAEIRNLISSIPIFDIEVVTDLPDKTDASTTTTYLKTNGGSGGNIYTEYILVNNEWEELGSQTIDLSNYYTKLEVDGLIPTKTSDIENDSGFITISDVSQGSTVEYTPAITEGTELGDIMINGISNKIYSPAIINTNWINGTGTGSVKLNSNSTSSGEYSIAAGYNASATNKYTTSIGKNVKSTNLYEVSLGIANVSRTSSLSTDLTRFSIGVGAIVYKNAFEVRGNGDVYIKGIGGFDGTASATGNDIKTVISNMNTSISTNTSNISSKEDKSTQSSFVNSATIEAVDNTEYAASELISTLTITNTDSTCYVISFDTVASGDITLTTTGITFNSSPVLGNNEHWIIAVYNGYASYKTYSI